MDLEYPCGTNDMVIIPLGEGFPHGKDMVLLPQDLKYSLGRGRGPEFPHGRDLGLIPGPLDQVYPHGRDLQDLIPQDLGIFLHGIKVAPLQDFLYPVVLIMELSILLLNQLLHLPPLSHTLTSQPESWCLWFE